MGTISRNTESAGVRVCGDVMYLEGVFLIERLTTELTLEWLDKHMRTLVRVKRRNQSEPLAAYIAFVRPVSCVAVYMRLEIALLIKSFPTETTFVHGNIRMSPHMVLKVSQLLESSSACLARVWFLPSVNVTVDLQVYLLIKTLRTVVALKWPVVRVRLHVHP